MNVYKIKFQKLLEYVEKNKKFPEFKGDFAKIERNELLYDKYKKIRPFQLEKSCHFRNQFHIKKKKENLRRSSILIPNLRFFCDFLSLALKYQNENLAWFSKAEWFNQNSSKIFEHLMSKPSPVKENKMIVEKKKNNENELKVKKEEIVKKQGKQVQFEKEQKIEKEQQKFEAEQTVEKKEPKVEKAVNGKECKEEKFDFISAWLKHNTLKSMESGIVVEENQEKEEKHQESESDQNQEQAESMKQDVEDCEENDDESISYDDENIETETKSAKKPYIDRVYQGRFNYWIKPYNSLRLVKY